MEEPKDKKIQWHPGFMAAIELELSENMGGLRFDREHILNTGTLSIDLLVIKKDPEVTVRNEIGEIFGTHNLWEYKSADDRLNIDVFYKVIGYACLYKSYGNTVDERHSDDITVTFVRKTKPEGLFRSQGAEGMQVQSTHKGIYRISGPLPFRIQAIVTRELEGGSHVWLKSLSGNLEKEDLQRLLEHMKEQTGKHAREMADSVLDVFIRANPGLVRQLKGDDDMSEALLELMEPILAERDQKRDQRNKPIWINQGRAEGREEGRIIAYYEMKYSTSQIAEKLSIDESEVERVIRDAGE